MPQPMRRAQFFLPPSLIARTKAYAVQKGISYAAVVRLALTVFLKGKDHRRLT